MSSHEEETLQTVTDLNITAVEEVRPEIVEYPKVAHQSVDHGKKSTSTNWKKCWESASDTTLLTFPKLNVTVGSCEVAGSMLSRYVLYVIRTEPLDLVVRRRWSEFVWLHSILVKNYIGLFVPALPNTGLLSGSSTNIEGTFVKNRMAQLNFFMNQIINIPFLRSDANLELFISAQGDIKSLMEQATKWPTPAETPGAVMWRAALHPVVIPLDAERSITELKRQLDLVRGALGALQDESILLGKQAFSFSKELSVASAVMAAWSEVEADVADPAKSEVPNPMGHENKAFTDALVVSFGHSCSSAYLVPKIIASILLASVQCQLIQVDGFRDFIKHRESIASQLEKAEREKVKLLEEKNKAPPTYKISMFSKGPADLEEAFLKKDEQVNALAASLAACTGGLLFCEIERFQQDRAAAIKHLAGSFVAAKLHIAHRDAARWTEIAALSNLTLSDYEETVQHALAESGSESTGEAGAESANPFAAEV